MEWRTNFKITSVTDLAEGCPSPPRVQRRAGHHTDWVEEARAAAGYLAAWPVMRHVRDDTCWTRDLCEVGVLLDVGSQSVWPIDGAGCLIPDVIMSSLYSCHLY